MSRTMSINYWLIVGSKKNWDTAFQHRNIWGLRKTQRLLWESINEKDKLVFYATQPVGGIIGYGVVRTKFVQDKPLWPDELKNNDVIWPLRFEFDVEFCFPPDKWKSEKVVSKELFPRAGFQQISESAARGLISAVQYVEYAIPQIEMPSVAEESSEFVITPKKQGKLLLSHDEAQDRLIRIGQLQNFIAEKEYPFDIGKLDVVWRRVTNSVPTYVFEVQIGGDIYHALGKLKHAFDLWNSHIFFVASEKDYSKATSLLSGTFHEISKRMKYIELGKVEELFQLKKAYFEFEKELGI
jgi:predicted RNA-binding protein